MRFKKLSELGNFLKKKDMKRSCIWHEAAL
jgi:hypothetical protein